MKKGKGKLTQAKEYQIVVLTDRQHGTHITLRLGEDSPPRLFLATEKLN